MQNSLCATCAYCDSGKDDMPCCYCVDGENYEEGEDGEW